jgi:hypothetical protein
VYWEFINYLHILDTFGYFKTNSTGGFNDYSNVDDLHPDEYIFRFIDDKNNDYNLDKIEKRDET